ncbi:MAG: GGDEF domain-containing protein [Cellvibrionaceae bacterium]|nr:GGDEF domain-containing protein [Cellvibrionaceae bacterium]
MSAANPWRDKYRRALAQQENLEQTLSAYQGILQRAVLALCGAAEGKDSGLDERLQAIRASAKHNDVAGFDRMIKSLGRVVEDAEQRQQQQWQVISQLFSTIASELPKLTANTDIKPAVKAFKKQLPKEGAALPSTIKRQLQQISDLQQLIINSTPKTSSRLLDKIFKSKEDTALEPRPTMPASEVPAEAEWEEISESEVNIEGEWAPACENSANYRERSLPEALLPETQVAEKTVDVPDRVSIILNELLDHFKTVPAAEEKAKHARKRLADGLQWYELAPTLEDIRDFVLLAYLSADEEYRCYLEAIYLELSTILEALGLSIATEQRARQASEKLHQQVSSGVDDMHQALFLHNDTAQLKAAVSDHLNNLQTALRAYQPPAADTGDSLSVQLQSLVDKVKTMEQGQTEMRHRLEQEKQRALTDTLTGLPNREAYSERLHQEVQRWQRYQHPLTLAIVDIDFFKKINDNYGHGVGDRVLKIVSAAIAKRLREVDFMARFGGEEFVLLLPETTGEQSLTLLNRIRESLAKAPFKYKDQKISITVSIGITAFNEGDHSQAVFDRADKALYDAKENGRNRCCLS